MVSALQSTNHRPSSQSYSDKGEYRTAAVASGMQCTVCDATCTWCHTSSTQAQAFPVLSGDDNGTSTVAAAAVHLWPDDRLTWRPLDDVVKSRIIADDAWRIAVRSLSAAATDVVG